MKAFSGLSIAAIAVIATSCASSLHGTTQSTARSYNGANFNGEWKLVRDRSDELDAGDRAEATWLLPSVVRIGSDSQTLRVQDDTGNLIAEMALDSDYPYTSAADRDVEGRARAHWAGPRRFVVERLDRDGQRMTQTFTLDSGGRQLVVRTQMAGEAGARTHTRIYQRI